MSRVTLTLPRDEETWERVLAFLVYHYGPIEILWAAFDAMPNTTSLAWTDTGDSLNLSARTNDASA